MNEQARSDLERLKQRHTLLEQELVRLSNELKTLEAQLNLPLQEAPKPVPHAPTASIKPIELSRQDGAPEPVRRAPLPIPLPPPPIPPVITPAPVVAQSSDTPASAAPKPAPPPETQRPRLRVDLGSEKFLKGFCKSCGGHLEFRTSVLGQTISCPHCGQSTVLSAAPGPFPAPPVLPQVAGSRQREAAVKTPAPRRAEAAGSFEMRLGTYWLVRIGIVVLLTGLVLFGNLAYQNYISRLGPGGKVFLLYLASALLLGAGWWWQRTALKESLKNYAQVLFAGGLAAAYFTTYAAHHFQHLRVIPDAGVDGALLLGLAGVMVWIADLKQSEVMALFAVLLAYYTAIISHDVGLFTLYSNLVLTLAAVFFLVRNRWATLSFASLLATYAAYAFWRFLHGNDWRWALPQEGLWTGTWFLISYWVVFTAAVFLSKDEKFAKENRAGFLTLNNGAFFTMFLLTMYQAHQGGFWKFSLVFGAVLLGLAEAAKRFLGPEPLAKNSYLTQGLLLVTVGFITKFSGLELALILAAESVMLLMVGQQRQSAILRAGGYVAAALAVGWGMDGMKRNDTHGLWLGIGLGVLMMWNTLLVHGKTQAERRFTLRPQPGYFTVLALLIWLVATYNNTSRQNFPAVLAVEGLLLTFSIYLLRVREIALFGQGYVALAQLVWLFNSALAEGPAPPWWDPALLIFVLLVLSHWWQRQTVLELRLQFEILCQGLYALAIIGVLYFWFSPKVDAPIWLALTSLFAVGLTAYGVWTRAWLLAACGQIFMLVSAAQFAVQLWEGKPHWQLPLAPIAALGVLSFGTVNWFERKPDPTGRISQPLLQIARLYRWTALMMSISWVCQYIPARERIWLLALLGLWVFLWAGWQRNTEALLFSAAYTLTALALFWLPLLQAPTVYWPNLLVILLLLGQRQMARRLPDRYPLKPAVHGAIITTGGLSLWLFLSRWVLQNASGFYLTASWSAFALVLFTAGMVLRERAYRWVGLGVLACALGRVALFDLWKLETLYRVLSFMALGIVLLVLGFIYSRYQEKIRQWL